MGAYLGYLLAGLGGGAVVASLALGLVLTWRTSRVVNFSHAAMDTYLAFATFEFRDRGDLVLPVAGIPARIHLLPTPTLAASLVFAVILSAAVGAAVFWLVFRPLRRAHPLARVVASLGLYLYFSEITRLRFPTAGATAVTRYPVLPEHTVKVWGTGVSANRLWLAVLVMAATAGLATVFARTRFGLATRAAAGNEKAAVLAGVSPDRVGLVNWMVASVLAGLAVLLIEPIAGLDPATTSLLVVPALAAALAGGLASFWVTTLAGLSIGMVQSLILGWAVRPDTNWIPSWIPVTGLQQAVPLAVVLAALAWRGDPLPTRGAVLEGELPASPEPRRVTLWAAAGTAAGVAGLFTFSAPYRQALIVSLIAVVLSLSIVVITGYVGQISLAQLAFAGVAGFTAVDLAADGLSFLPVVVAVAVATLVGVAVGVPALRVRGMSLAVATMALAVAIEQLVLGSEALSGGAGGRSVPRPYLLGVDVGISAPGADNFRPAFGLVALAAAVGSAVLVANLRRRPTGLRWLAVRANERAAAAAGIDVARVKLGAFALSSALAGLAGALTAFATTALSTSSFMVVGSLVALAMTYLTGIAGVTGAVLAGLLAQSGLVTVLGRGGTAGGGGDHTFLVSGLALVVMAVVAPEGLTGLVRRGWDRLSARPAGVGGRSAVTSAVATDGEVER